MESVRSYTKVFDSQAKNIILCRDSKTSRLSYINKHTIVPNCNHTYTTKFIYIQTENLGQRDPTCILCQYNSSNTKNSTKKRIMKTLAKGVSSIAAENDFIVPTKKAKKEAQIQPFPFYLLKGDMVRELLTFLPSIERSYLLYSIITWIDHEPISNQEYMEIMNYIPNLMGLADWPLLITREMNTHKRLEVRSLFDLIETVVMTESTIPDDYVFPSFMTKLVISSLVRPYLFRVERSSRSEFEYDLKFMLNDKNFRGKLETLEYYEIFESMDRKKMDVFGDIFGVEKLKEQTQLEAILLDRNQNWMKDNVFKIFRSLDLNFIYIGSRLKDMASLEQSVLYSFKSVEVHSPLFIGYPISMKKPKKSVLDTLKVNKDVRLIPYKLSIDDTLTNSYWNDSFLNSLQNDKKLLDDYAEDLKRSQSNDAIKTILENVRNLSYLEGYYPLEAELAPPLIIKSNPNTAEYMQLLIITALEGGGSIYNINKATATSTAINMISSGTERNRFYEFTSYYDALESDIRNILVKQNTFTLKKTGIRNFLLTFN